jgi:hypothetical protein
VKIKDKSCDLGRCCERGQRCVDCEAVINALFFSWMPDVINAKYRKIFITIYLVHKIHVRSVLNHNQCCPPFMAQKNRYD